MSYTAEQYRAAAKRAAEGGDMASARSLIAKGMALEKDMAKVPLGRAVMQGLGQGVSGGFMDETAGAISGAIGTGPSTEAMRNELQGARRDHPIAAYGAEVIGSLLPGSAMLRLASQIPKVGGMLAGPATNMAQRIGKGAVAGLTGGAIYGAGSDEGGVLDRLDGAAKGAAVGAGVGAAAAPLVSTVGALTAPLREGVSGALGIGNNKRAQRAIAEALSRSGKSMDDVSDDLARAAREGQPEFALADALGHPGQRMLAGQARRPGDGRTEIVNALRARQDGQGQRIGGEIADQLAPAGRVPTNPTLNATGPRVTGSALADNLGAARGAAADVNYSAARATAGPVDIRGVVSVIDQRIGPMKGSGIKGDGVDAKLDSIRRRLINDGGDPTIELSDFARLTRLKREIDGMIGKANRSGDNFEVSELMGVKKELDSALEASSTGYRQANDEFAAASRVIGAVDDGSTAARSTRSRIDDTAQDIGAMTPEQRAAYGVGYGDTLLGRVENAAPGVNKARQISDPKTASDLGLLAKDRDRLGRFVDRENTMFETARQAMGGSQTADNLADAAEAGGFDASAIANLLTGNFRTGTQQVLAAVSQASKGQNEATRQIIARALLSNDPKAALAKAMKQAGTDQNTRAVIEALIRQSVSRPTINALQ